MISEFLNKDTWGSGVLKYEESIVHAVKVLHQRDKQKDIYFV